MMKRFISVFFAVVCMLCLASSALHTNGAESSNLTVVMKYGNTVLNGIHVAVCRVADMWQDSDGVGFTVTQAFSGAAPSFSDLSTEKNIALAKGLNAYAAANNIPRDANVTDKDGKAIFTGLSDGLYLVAQQDSENSEYIIAPYLVAVPVPNETKAGRNYDVISYPKTEPVKRDVKTVSVSVYKIWRGTDTPPDSVQMQLYQNGNASGDPVSLSAQNDWSYTWDNLSPDFSWSVDEPIVPAGFTKAVSGNPDNGFVITNSIVVPSSTSPSKPLPKTGVSDFIPESISLATASALLAVISVLYSKRGPNPN